MSEAARSRPCWLATAATSGAYRGADAWAVWRQRLEDHVLLTDLDLTGRPIQLASLRSCLGDDTLRAIRHLDIPERYEWLWPWR